MKWYNVLVCVCIFSVITQDYHLNLLCIWVYVNENAFHFQCNRKWLRVYIRYPNMCIFLRSSYRIAYGNGSFQFGANYWEIAHTHSYFAHFQVSQCVRCVYILDMLLGIITYRV